MQYTFDLTGQSGWVLLSNPDYADNVHHISSSTMLMVGEAGNDTLQASDSSPGDWLVDSWDGLLIGGGDDSFFGASGNDTLAGEDGNDSLSGAGGNDLIYGGDGNDTLDGGDGDGTLSGGEGNDLLNGGNGNDSLTGELGNDTIYGGSGDDTLGGLGGDDQLYGGDGSDTYRINSLNDVVVEVGGKGYDVIVTGSISVDLANYIGIEDIILRGSDSLWAVGNADNNELVGNAGANMLSGLGGHDNLRAGGGNDNLYGGDGEDWMHGNQGADLLQGGAGNDTLSGGYGRDTLTGGDGADTFIFAAAGQSYPGQNRDTITDFTSGEDKIHLADFMSDAALVASFSATGAAEIRFDAGRERLMGDVDGNGVADWAITLTGVDSISASDLILFT